jgi:Skp family chaperone for outer membrane proteins
MAERPAKPRKGQGQTVAHRLYLWALIVWAVSAPLVAQGRDVRELVAAGLVEMEASGGGLTSVWLLLRNKSDSGVHIVVPSGIYFRNRGTNQDMLTVAASNVSLAPGESTRLVVPVACATAHRGEPNPADRFDVADSPPAAKSFARVALTGLSQVSIQVALWVLTDDITLEFLKNRYRSGTVPALAGSGPPAASETDIANAIRALRTAGTDLTKHRICAREGVAVPEGAAGFGYFDANRAIEETAVGKALKAQFEKTARAHSAQLVDDRAKLERAQQEWRDGRSMSDAARTRLEREIQRLQVEIIALERDQQNQQADLLAAFEKKVAPTIEQVLRDRRVVWGTTMAPACAGSREALVDITDEVVRRLNSSG